MNNILTTLTTLATLTGASTAATTIAINVMRSPTQTPAANDGSEFGISTWVNVAATDLTLNTDGVNFTWNSAGAWSGGGNNIENGYNDNAGFYNITGLSAWLTTNGAISYTVQTIAASDTASNWFGDTELRDTNVSGALLDTLSNPNLNRGASTISSDLTADSLFLDPTTGGVAPAGGVNSRTNVAGIIIKANVIPEPSSSALIGLGSLTLLIRRKR